MLFSLDQEGRGALEELPVAEASLLVLLLQSGLLFALIVLIPSLLRRARGSASPASAPASRLSGWAPAIWRSRSGCCSASPSIWGSPACSTPWSWPPCSFAQAWAPWPCPKIKSFGIAHLCVAVLALVTPMTLLMPSLVELSLGWPQIRASPRRHRDDRPHGIGHGPALPAAADAPLQRQRERCRLVLGAQQHGLGLDDHRRPSFWRWSLATAPVFTFALGCYLLAGLSSRLLAPTN